MTVTSLHAQKLTANIDELCYGIAWNTGKCEELREQIEMITVWIEECSMSDCFTCDYNRSEIVDLTLDIAELTLASEELTDTLQCRMLELEIELLPRWIFKFTANGTAYDCIVSAKNTYNAIQAFIVTHNDNCVLTSYYQVSF